MCILVEQGFLSLSYLFKNFDDITTIINNDRRKFYKFSWFGKRVPRGLLSYLSANRNDIQLKAIAGRLKIAWHFEAGKERH